MSCGHCPARHKAFGGKRGIVPGLGLAGLRNGVRGAGVDGDVDSGE